MLVLCVYGFLIFLLIFGEQPTYDANEMEKKQENLCTRSISFVGIPQKNIDKKKPQESLKQKKIPTEQKISQMIGQVGLVGGPTHCYAFLVKLQ